MRSVFDRLCLRLRRWQCWFFLLPVSLFLPELFGFLFLGYQPGEIENHQLWPLAFGALWAVALGCVLWMLPRKISRIAYGILYFLLVIYAGVQTGYFILFGEMMWLSDFRYASEGSDYFDVLLNYPAFWWLGLAVMVAIGAVLLWKFPRWNRGPIGFAFAALLAVVSMSRAWTLPDTVFEYDYQRLAADDGMGIYADGDYGRMQSAEAAYNNMFNAHRLYEICGLQQMLCKDIYTHQIYPLTPAFAKAQQQAVDQLEEHFAHQGEHEQNEMTGLLKGKNVILVLMESMDDWMIGEHTPTLVKLMEEGINFTQFYTPGYGGIRTFNTEFCINTGSFLSSAGGYAFDYVTNHFDQSLASRLRNAGYSAKTFHYNDPAFYSRGVFSQAMGYEEYVYYRDFVEEDDWEMAQYDDNLLFDNEGLHGDFFREGQPTLNFVITRSAHLSYRYNEVLSWWGLQKYPQYRRLTNREETNCALLKARLVDDMFARMLEELQAEGELENTVIIGVTDHYTYGYRHDDGTTDVESLMELSGVSHELLLEKTPCFIWSKDLQPMEVDKILNTADLLPTVLNLMGAEGSAHYLGRDAFDEKYEGFVPFSDGSWIAGDVVFDSAANQFYSLEGKLPQLREEWIDGMHEKVQAFVESNNLILQTDYYKGRT